jgi:hypothetical protein
MDRIASGSEGRDLLTEHRFHILDGRLGLTSRTTRVCTSCCARASTTRATTPFCSMMGWVMGDPAHRAIQQGQLVGQLIRLFGPCTMCLTVWK